MNPPRRLQIESLETRMTPSGGLFDVLVLSETQGFRHGSIPAAVQAISELGEQHGFRVQAESNSETFTDEGLADFEVILFLNTTGDVLDEAEQAAMERFVQNGGGFVGVHAAADTEYDWPWYGQLVGAYFRTHPPIAEATVTIVDDDHPASELLPSPWIVTDEWYDFRENPAANVRVLATLDEDSYPGGSMGDYHPISWSHEFDGGRAFYTGLGHRAELYADENMRTHLLGGIFFAAEQEQSQLDADIDQDGLVGFSDFLILSANFGGEVSVGSGGDLNGDARVDFDDFLILADQFGATA